MNNAERQLLYCLTAYRLGRTETEEVDSLCAGDWQYLTKLAISHKLQAVVCDTMWQTPGFCGGNQQFASAWRRETILQTAAQSARTQRLLRLTQAMDSEGVNYAVVKGIVCRALYTRPDLRPSGDEDILIAPGDYPRCSELFVRDGLESVTGEEGSVTNWRDRQTGLHLELHTEAFSSIRDADKLLNTCFSSQLNQTDCMQAAGGTVRTLMPTYHFLFLVCHALMHFISGGFGIRTLCDIVTFAEKYSQTIDRQTVYDWLAQVRGRVFLDQLLAIGRDYLEFDPDASGWHLSQPADTDELLADILDAGIYGQSTMSRRHSGGLVWQAAEAELSRPSLLWAAFPPKEHMIGRYPVLLRAPSLLPVMWLRRLGTYGLELMKSSWSNNSPIKSLALGKKRTEMMIKYGIIPHINRKN